MFLIRFFLINIEHGIHKRVVNFWDCFFVDRWQILFHMWQSHIYLSWRSRLWHHLFLVNTLFWSNRVHKLLTSNKITIILRLALNDFWLVILVWFAIKKVFLVTWWHFIATFWHIISECRFDCNWWSGSTDLENLSFFR